MYVSCKYCSSRHKRGVICSKKPAKIEGKKTGSNFLHRFRSSRIWQLKRESIKKRDRFLCLFCKYQGRYIFKSLEVHHIAPISIEWNKRLDSNNLITLCSSCHKQADKGEIEKDLLIKLVNESESDSIRLY